MQSCRSPKLLKHIGFWPHGRTSARWCWYREAMGGPGPGCLVSAAAKQLYSRIPVSNNVLWNLQ